MLSGTMFFLSMVLAEVQPRPIPKVPIVLVSKQMSPLELTAHIRELSAITEADLDDWAKTKRFILEKNDLGTVAIDPEAVGIALKGSERDILTKLNSGSRVRSLKEDGEFGKMVGNSLLSALGTKSTIDAEYGLSVAMQINVRVENNPPSRVVIDLPISGKRRENPAPVPLAENVSDSGATVTGPMLPSPGSQTVAVTTFNVSAERIRSELRATAMEEVRRRVVALEEEIALEKSQLMQKLPREVLNLFQKIKSSGPQLLSDFSESEQAILRNLLQEKGLALDDPTKVRLSGVGLIGLVTMGSKSSGMLVNYTSRGFDISPR